MTFTVTGNSVEPARAEFMAWCERVGLDPSHLVAVRFDGESLRVGVQWVILRKAHLGDPVKAAVYDEANEGFAYFWWHADVDEPPPPAVLACAEELIPA